MDVKEGNLYKHKYYTARKTVFIASICPADDAIRNDCSKGHKCLNTLLGVGILFKYKYLTNIRRISPA